MFNTPLVVVVCFSAKCKITEVQKCEGEAVANNRKGKLIFFYEWDIVLKWTGRLEGGENEVEGTINIPNLSEENDASEIDVSLRVFVVFS
jgi:activator of HSP90 ATPase